MKVHIIKVFIFIGFVGFIYKFGDFNARIDCAYKYFRIPKF
ncbi:MAG: hypothetical protein ACI4OT_00250 [Bacilli bacterium]